MGRFDRFRRSREYTYHITSLRLNNGSKIDMSVRFWDFMRKPMLNGAAVVVASMIPLTGTIFWRPPSIPHRSHFLVCRAGNLVYLGPQYGKFWAFFGAKVWSFCTKNYHFEAQIVHQISGPRDQKCDLFDRIFGLWAQNSGPGDRLALSGHDAGFCRGRWLSPSYSMVFVMALYEIDPAVFRSGWEADWHDTDCPCEWLVRHGGATHCHRQSVFEFSSMNLTTLKWTEMIGLGKPYQRGLITNLPYRMTGLSWGKNIWRYRQFWITIRQKMLPPETWILAMFLSI